MSAVNMRKQAEVLLKLAEIEEKIRADTGLDGCVRTDKDPRSGVDCYRYGAKFFETRVGVGLGNEVDGTCEYLVVLAAIKSQLRAPTENDIKVLGKMGYHVTKAMPTK